MRTYSLFAGVLLLALVLSVGIGYSMWSSRLRVNVGVHTAASSDPLIESYKTFICCSHEHYCCSNHNDTVTDYCHRHHSGSCDCKGVDESQVKFTNNMRTIMITGLECNGSCSCCSSQDYSSNSSVYSQHCSHGYETNMSLWVGLILKNNGELPVRLTEVLVTIDGSYDGMYLNYYAYGPFITSFQQVWGHVNPCDLPFSGYNNDIILDGNEKMVLWTNIRLTNTTSISSIIITPTYENWNEHP